MLDFFITHSTEVKYSIVLVLVYFFLRILITKIIKKFSSKTIKNPRRTKVIIKYTDILLLVIAITFFFIIWGVKTEHLAFTFSSIFAVIGVALFAQWSLLSNVTAGIIIFFTAPFKIDDIIKIHDKDFPYEATILDIKGFHIYLETQEGEIVVLPNNIFFTKSISILKDFSKEKSQE